MFDRILRASSDKSRDVSAIPTSFPRGGVAKGGSEVRRTGGEEPSLFSVGGASKRNATQDDVKKRRGKALKASTAKRTKLRRQDERRMRHGDQQEEAVDSMKMPKFVEPLRFKKLNVGMILCGYVKEVRQADATVSLPNNLTGWVEIDEISDELSTVLEEALEDEEAEAPPLEDYLFVGMPVRCVILSTAVLATAGKLQHKNISVSIKPSRVNAALALDTLHKGLSLYGAVSSKQEKGYTISLGTSEATAFLPLQEVLTGELKVGQLLETYVKKVKKEHKLAIVSCKRESLEDSLTKEIESLTLDNLLPGMLFKCKIARVHESGLVVRFLNYFFGTVDLFHLPLGVERFKEKQTVTARIIVLDVGANRIGLSLRPHVLEGSPPPYVSAHVKMGQRFDAAIVRRVDPEVGVLLEVKQGEEDGESLEGYVHISNVSDERVEKVEKELAVGKEVACRVIGFSWADGLVNLSMKPSVLAADVLLYEDVAPGDVVKVKVERLSEEGCLVAVSDNVRGYIPASHFADVALANPERRLLPGKILTARVLQDAGHKLAAPDHPRRRRSGGPGVPRSGVQGAGERSAGELLRVGQGVPAAIGAGDGAGGAGGRLFQARPGPQGPRALGRNGEEANRAEPQDRGSQRQCEGRRLHNCEVRLQRSARGENGGERAKEGQGSDELVLAGLGSESWWRSRWLRSRRRRCLYGQPTEPSASFLSRISLTMATSRPSRCSSYSSATDSPASSSTTSPASPGSPSSSPLLFSPGSPPRGLSLLVRYLVTLKPSLLAAMREESFPSSLAQLHPQQFLQGYVFSVKACGVFVRFLGRLTALAPSSSLAEEFVEDPHAFFAEGQSVRCCVVAVDEEQQRAKVIEDGERQGRRRWGGEGERKTGEGGSRVLKRSR
eukprot:762756-Hanusia_phi.AAC.1